MDKEKFLMFCASCIHKEVEDPTVWDVDSLTDAANQFLTLLHLAPVLDKALVQIQGCEVQQRGHEEVR